MNSTIYEDGEWRVRRAEPADSAALCALLREVHVRGELDMTLERDPDFFALLRMHMGEHDVWLMEDRKGGIGGCGSVTVRPGWVDGQIEPVGYLGDLRARPGFRGVRLLPQLYKLALEQARERHGARAFYTVIFDDNLIAKRALVGRRRKRKEQPVYREMTPFQMTNVQFTTPKGKPRQNIRRARDRDLDALVAFLARQQQRRTMGEVVDEAWLRRRFSTWPGFGIDSFLLARDAGGEIVGTLAPYDASAFKRTRVLGYYGNMRWVRRAFDLGALVLRYPRLPAPGECFRFVFLSHLEVAEDDPSVLRDLLLAAYRRLAPDRLHFMSAMIPRGSRLERAFRGFTVNRSAMTVYSVTSAGDPRADYDFGTQHPGFEMALS